MYELENIKEDFFEDLNLSHSVFQIENFILGSEMGLTPWGKYKQCLREIHRRVRSLKDINYQIAKKEIEIKRLEMQETKDALEEEENKLDIDYQKDNLKLLYDQKSDIKREGDVFLKQHDIVKKELKKLREEGKSKEDLEKEYWITKLKRDLENSIMCTGTANQGLLQSIRGIADQEISSEIFAEFWKLQVQNMVDKRGLMEKAQEVVTQFLAKSS